MPDAAEEPDVRTPLHEGPPSLLDLLPMHRGAYIVDEERARDSPCLCRELKRGGDICFSHGAVGPLNKEQEALFCAAGKETLSLAEEDDRRLNRYADAAYACGTEEGFPSYLSCVHREVERLERQAR